MRGAIVPRTPGRGDQVTCRLEAIPGDDPGTRGFESIHTFPCPSPRARSPGMGARPVRPRVDRSGHRDRPGPLGGHARTLRLAARPRRQRHPPEGGRPVGTRRGPLSGDARGAPVARHASDPVLELRAGHRRSDGRGHRSLYGVQPRTAPGLCGGDCRRAAKPARRRRRRPSASTDPISSSTAWPRPTAAARSRTPGRSPRGGTRGGMVPGLPSSRAASAPRSTSAPCSSSAAPPASSARTRVTLGTSRRRSTSS